MLILTANFHFALVGHLLKGYRHPQPATVARTGRILHTLLSIAARPHRRDRFEVAGDNIAYLVGRLLSFFAVNGCDSLCIPLLLEGILSKRLY